jgi:hypothetical protein
VKLWQLRHRLGAKGLGDAAQPPLKAMVVEIASTAHSTARMRLQICDGQSARRVVRHNTVYEKGRSSALGHCRDDVRG